MILRLFSEILCWDFNKDLGLPVARDTEKSDPGLSVQSLGLRAETNPVPVCSRREGRSRGSGSPPAGRAQKDECLGRGWGVGGGGEHCRHRK